MAKGRGVGTPGEVSTGAAPGIAQTPPIPPASAPQTPLRVRQVYTEQANIPPIFKLVFLCTFSLTVLSLLIAALFGFVLSTPSEMAKTVVEACIKIAFIGAGAVFGLLGGKGLK